MNTAMVWQWRQPLAKRVVPWICAGIMGVAGGCAALAGVILQDQGVAGLPVTGGSVVGQTFTAEETRIRGIGIRLKSRSLATPGAVLLELYEGVGDHASPLAAVAGQVPPNFAGYFETPLNGVNFTPGARYTFTLRMTDAPLGMLLASSNLLVNFDGQPIPDRVDYPGGALFLDSRAIPQADLRFYVMPLDGALSGIGFAVAQVEAPEAGGPVTLKVVRTGPTDVELLAQYRTVVTPPSAAEAGIDFVAQTGTVRLAPGETEATLSIPILDNELYRTNCALDVELHSPGAGTYLQTERVEVSILDDDRVQIDPQSTTIRVRESDGRAVVPLVRSGKISRAATVRYETQDLEARAGADYTASSGTITFAAGQVTAQLELAILRDGLMESEEAFQLFLTSTDADVPVEPIRVEIVDSTVLVEFETASTNVLESADEIAIPVLLRGQPGQVVTVGFETIPGTATPNADYTPVSGQVSFALGGARQFISIPILADGLMEGPETFLVRLTMPGEPAQLGDKREVVVTLVNQSSVIEFVATSIEVSERSGRAVLALRRTGLADSEAAVLYQTQSIPGTASAALDFAPAVGRIVFAPGQAAASLEVEILDDMLPEPDEWFQVVLAAGSGNVELPAPAARVTILDDHAQVEFSAGTFAAGEAQGAASVILRRTRNLERSVTVRCITANGTAIAGIHYTATSGTVEFLPGETAKTIVIPIADNPENEPDRWFTVRLVEIQGEAVAGPLTETRVSIGNDDQSVRFAETEVLARGVIARVTVRRGEGSFGSVAVDYRTADRSALAGVDYEATTGRLEFSAGTASMEIEVPIRPEASRGTQFRVLLSNPAGASLAEPDEAVVVIQPVRTLGIDYSFRAAPASESLSYVVGVQPSGRVVYTQGSTAYRLNPDGSPDPTFPPVQVGSFDSTRAMQSDGRIVFPVFSGGGSASPFLLRRLGVDGEIEAEFSARQIWVSSGPWVGPEDRIYFIENESGASILRRLDPDGQLDPAFRIEQATSTFGVDSRGRIYILRTGQPFARLLADGSVDGLLPIPPGRTLTSFSVAPDDHLYVALADGGIVRFKPDLTLDASWSAPVFQDRSGRLWPLPDGELLVQRIASLAVLAQNGSLRQEFNPFLERGFGLTFSPRTGETWLSGSRNRVDLRSLGPIVRLTLDPPPVLEWAQPVTQVYADEGQVALRLVRRDGLRPAASVSVSTRDGVARAGFEYTAVRQRLEFAAGEAEKWVTIPIHPAPGRGPAGFFVELSAAEGSRLGPWISADVAIHAAPAGEYVVDWNFLPNLVTQPTTAMWQEGGRIVLSILEHGADRFVRMNSRGEVDHSFDSSSPVGVTNRFRRLVPAGDRFFAISQTLGFRNLTGFLPNGGVDPTFNLQLDIYNILAALPVEGGKTLLAYPGSPDSIVRVQADGSNDPSFPALRWSSGISTLLRQKDGRVLVAGRQIGRMHSNGEPDASFAGLQFEGQISALAIQEDGKIVMGGGGFALAGGVVSPGLVRLHADGTLDRSFQSSLPSGAWVYDVVAQSDGTLLLAGAFERPIRRFLAKGADDPSFTLVVPNGLVTQILPEDSENFTIVGDFTQPTRGIARLTTRKVVPPRLVLELGAAQEFRLQVAGSPGREYEVQESTTLREWSQRMIVTNAYAGGWHLLPPAASGTPARFFRAVQR